MPARELFRVLHPAFLDATPRQCGEHAARLGGWLGEARHEPSRRVFHCIFMCETPPERQRGLEFRSAERDFVEAARVVLRAAVCARDFFDFRRGTMHEERAVVDLTVPHVPFVHEEGRAAVGGTCRDVLVHALVIGRQSDGEDASRDFGIARVV
jgi:hypothetical protein